MRPSSNDRRATTAPTVPALRRSLWCFGLTVLAVSLLHTAPVAAQKAKKKPSTSTQPTPRVVPAAELARAIPAETAPAEHPLAPALDLAKRSRAALKGVRDYTAQFSKRELLANRLKSQVMDVKIREQPFSVYFHFRGGPEAGREVLFVDGANRGHLLVHEDGIKAIAGTLSFVPTSPEVMKENRYPITQVGISQMLETIISQWEQEVKFGEVEVRFFPDARLGESACQAFESSHPQPRREFKFHITRLYFDKQSNLPLRVEQFGWPRSAVETPPVVEEYSYSNLKVNVGLTDQDFDRRNRNYRF